MSDSFPWSSWISRLGSGPLLFPLPPRAWIIVQGNDAVRFLNGQCSNQMAHLPAESALRTCILTIKGKLVAAPWAWQNEDGQTVLEVPAAQAEAVLQRLDRYLVADDVEISTTEAPPTWHLTGCGWPAASVQGLRTIPRLGQPGWDFPGEEPPSQRPASATLGSSADLEALRVALGQPGEETEITADVFPSEIGLDRTAVDFHKGCYLGQEVVSRLESVGQARRGLLRWTCPVNLPRETPLQQASEGGSLRPVGFITSRSPASEHGLWHGLALVRTDLVSPGSSLSASQADGPALEVMLHSIS
jgi:folate-binding protein YgfZ